jgi:hypothetical protein
MEKFTIHIFGYGETQIISKDLSVKVKTTELTKVQPLVDAIWAKKPEDSEAEEKYHVIHCFSYDDVRWVSKNGFALKDEEENLKPLINDLITELESKKPVEEQEQEVN